MTRKTTKKAQTPGAPPEIYGYHLAETQRKIRRWRIARIDGERVHYKNGGWTWAAQTFFSEKACKEFHDFERWDRITKARAKAVGVGEKLHARFCRLLDELADIKP